MGSIRVTNKTKLLFVDFRYRGERCREYTALPETLANRKRLQKVLDQIEAQILDGTFVYQRYFPNSKLVEKFEQTLATKVPMGGQISVATSHVTTHLASTVEATPLFTTFADEWFAESEVRWRKSYRLTISDILRLHLKPEFGQRAVGQITKADILKFRSLLAKAQTRKNQRELSASRINYIMMALRQILTEAADRFNYTNPYRGIKPLKVKKSDVQPFSIEEVQLILNSVRVDFRNYYTVRFFTGMRTGEIDGLKWEYVDFPRRLILVRETVVNGEEEYTKTDASQRDIQMSQLVYDALKAQERVTAKQSKFVFSNAEGNPLEHNNVSKRVWYPLLRYLELKNRRPYQTRHTAATLWLASGENPQWIARQLGHGSTEMLFSVYSRFVPNLTRQDGSAFERLLTGVMGGGDRQLTLTASAERTSHEVANEVIHESIQALEVNHA